MAGSSWCSRSDPARWVQWSCTWSNQWNISVCEVTQTASMGCDLSMAPDGKCHPVPIPAVTPSGIRAWKDNSAPQPALAGLPQPSDSQCWLERKTPQSLIVTIFCFLLMLETCSAASQASSFPLRWNESPGKLRAEGGA